MIKDYFSELNKIRIKSDLNYFTEKNGYFGITKNGDYSFGVLSSENNDKTLSINYKKISINCNIGLVSDQNNSIKRFHVINFKSESAEQVNLFYTLFSALLNDEKYTTDDFMSVYNMINEIFNFKTEYSVEELIGLYGELYFINAFGKKEILHNWHSDYNNKFDFSISEKFKIEVKTTLKNNRIHHFKHNQLTNEIYDIYVISLLLQSDDRGVKLSELILGVIMDLNPNTKVFNYLTNIYNFIITNKNFDYSFNSEYTNLNLKIFNSKLIPRFSETTKEGVFNAEYDVDLTNISGLILDEFRYLFNSK
jgi:hypothetical protein